MKKKLRLRLDSNEFFFAIVAHQRNSVREKIEAESASAARGQNQQLTSRNMG